jgi:hypothetical protein
MVTSVEVARAAVPPVINYQGILQRSDKDSGRRDERNSDRDDDHDHLRVTFSIFADSLGGAALWSETYPKFRTREGGAFDVLLGSVNPLPAAVFSGSRLWLETAVNGKPLSPRSSIVSVGYSFRAAAADSAIHAATSADSVWGRRGNDIFYKAGRVGVGTEAPSIALDVSGEAAATCVTIRGGCDLSEAFDVAPAGGSNVEPGMVVSLDPDKAGTLILSSVPYDSRVVGVVSGANGIQAGMVMRQIGNAELDGFHNVALSGRVYVHASALNGPIVPGDQLTASSLPGYAMKATDPGRGRGAVIGKAMSSLKKGTGFVLLLIQPQ